MEDRLSRLEGKMYPPEQEKTYAKAVMASATSDSHPVPNLKGKKQDNKIKENKNKHQTAAPVPEIEKSSTQVRKNATAIRPSAKANRKNQLKPKQQLPTVVVKSVSQEIGTSMQLKERLETAIHPNTLGIKIITSRLTFNKGMVLQVQTNEMAQKLQEAINGHDNLKNICGAHKPKERIPHIMVYDIEKCGEETTREIEEQSFLKKVKESNSLPDGEMKVLFRKKGSGSREHWIISMDPAIFKQIKGEKRIQFGFGSFRFKEFIEPMRCFRCHKYGHGKKTCMVDTEHCSKCPGMHSFKECKATEAVCRNCRDFNRKSTNKVRVNHTATSDKCPIFLREREQLKLKTNYGD
ncbi:hypothetical protein AVEN_107939-1 [Araneus ventricosus]|uniref:CCHC-type domain-containing protein n=1 Tax=Araneus ventricosus TaxID=182803 RepID=A0A4Y2IY87_ARAVE|nr:hypothetical protein AVEN_107939-1 [Araneus ventricosus]